MLLKMIYLFPAKLKILYLNKKLVFDESGATTLSIMPLYIMPSPWERHLNDYTL